MAEIKNYIKIELVNAATVVTVSDQVTGEVNRKIVANETTNFYAHPNKPSGFITFPCDRALDHLGLRVETLHPDTLALLGNPTNAFELCDAMAGAKFFQNII